MRLTQIPPLPSRRDLERDERHSVEATNAFLRQPSDENGSR
jgi:hypothetical protein